MPCRNLYTTGQPGLTNIFFFSPGEKNITITLLPLLSLVQPQIQDEYMEKGMEAELIKLREETIDQLMAKNLAAAYALKDFEREDW